MSEKMKIVILMGSPNRKGSTNILVENFVKGAEEAGRKERRKKERKRLIKEANRMLISAPKKSANSLGFLSFDPSGAFCFDGGRWVKVFEVTGKLEKLVKASLKVKSRVRITERIVPAKGESHTARAFVSLIAEGDIYEPVREQFESDEAVLNEMVALYFYLNG